MCDAVAAAVVPSANRFLPVLQRVDANPIAMVACMLLLQKALYCLHECLHGACFGGKAGGGNMVFSSKKWRQPAMRRAARVCDAVASAVFPGANQFLLTVLQRVDA